MERQPLITDWIKVATSGRAFDGRVIEPQWLLEMAADYSPETYTALLWPDHERLFNYGEVKELKAEAAGGKVELWARFAPNSFYLQNNQQKQGLFFSIEVDLDVASPGRAYLGGLAVTDSPASLGLPPTYFKAGQANKRQYFSSEEKAPLPEELGAAAAQDQGAEIRTIFEAFKSELSTFFSKFSKKYEETDVMEKWEEAVAQLREELGGRINTLEERVKSVEATVESFADMAKKHSATGDESGKDKEKLESEAGKNGEEDKKKDEEYSRQFAALHQKFDDMLSRFSQGQPGTRAPENTGAAGLEPLL